MSDDINIYGLKSITHWSLGLEKHPQWSWGLEKLGNIPDDLQFTRTQKAKNPHTSSGEVHPTPSGWPSRHGSHKSEPTGTGGQSLHNAKFTLLVLSLTTNKSMINNWRGLEHATLKHADLAYYFELKALKNNRSEKGTLTSPFLPENRR